MILAIQIILTGGMLLLSLLLFMMIRQIGIISRRIPKIDEGAAVSAPPGVGSHIGLTRFASYDGSTEYTLPVAGEGSSYLIFASFSCPNCRPLLERLSSLPANAARRTILFLSDHRPPEQICKTVVRLGLGEIRVARGHELSRSLRITRTPFGFAVGATGIIEQAGPVSSLEDLMAMTDHRARRSPSGKEQFDAQAA